MLRETHPRTFFLLSLLFALFVLFLYGPTIDHHILSFQGPNGGLVFPMQGFRCTGSPTCSSPSRSATSAAASTARSSSA